MALYTWSMRFLAFYVSLVFLIASSCFTKFFFLMAYIVKYSGLYLLEYYSSYVGIIIPMHSFEITFKSNWYLQVLVQWKGISGCIFLENPKTDLWSLIIRILHYQKNRRSEKGSFTMTTACPRTPRGKKKNKTNWSSRRRQEEKAT